jgi:hypothetical protein
MTDTSTHTVDSLRTLVSQGRTSEAVEELTRIAWGLGPHQADPSGDPLDWAGLAEELGLFDLAGSILRKAHAIAPDSPDILSRLAEHCLEQGEAPAAVPLLRRLLKTPGPRSSAALQTLADLHASASDDDGRKATHDAAIEAGMDASLVRRVLGGASQAFPAADPSDLALEEERPTQLPGDEDVVRFLHLFAGRENAHARMWANPKKGLCGYSPVEEPLTPRTLRQHFLGDVTVGVYCLRLDNTASFFAFDLDLNRRALEGAHRPEEATRLRSELRKAVGLVTGRLDGLGIGWLLESSGYKGFHVWCFLEQPAPAALLYQFGQALLRSITPHLPLDLDLEFFPKQCQRQKAGYGNLIKLPLGMHLKTGKRSALLTSDFVPCERPFELLRQVRRVAPDVLAASLSAAGEKAVIPFPGAAAPPVEGATTDEELPFHESAPGGYVGDATPPAWTEADFALDPVVSLLFSRCPLLAAVKARVDRHGQLGYEELTMLQHVLGHLPTGLLAVNYLLSRCPGLQKDLALKSILRGNPVSCQKMRSKLKDLAAGVDCACTFDRQDHYPTPLLHLDSLSPAGNGPAWRRLQEQVAARTQTVLDSGRQYLRLLGMKQRIEHDLDQSGKVLWAQLMAMPDRSLTLEDGTLTAVEGGGLKEVRFVPAAPNTNAKAEE